MDRINGGQAALQVLQNAGVKTVFGLLGGSMLELYDALYHSDETHYIGARDERAAGHMADAYARTTGGPGVVLGAQAGPGVVNLATAVAEAHLAYAPLVVIAGAISRGDQGKDTFQEVDQVALFAPISKRSRMVTEAERLPAMLEDALRLAMSGRRGPVVLHVPRDVWVAKMPRPKAAPLYFASAGAPPAATVEAMRSALASSQRPVIVAGGGLKHPNGRQALLALAEGWQLPVVCSTGHADVMPHGHPLNAGQAGPRGNRVASGLTRDADCLLVLGARLGFNSTFHSAEYVNPDAKVLHIDIDASAIGRYFPVSLGCQADAASSAEALAEGAAPNPAWRPWCERFRQDLAQLRQQREAEAQNPALPMLPTRALAEIRAQLPQDAIVTLDTGNACLQAADRLAHYDCPSLITPLDFGLVGFAYAAALGAQAAAPDRPVVCIMGDGGFGFTLAEVTSAVQNQLPVVAVVLDNGAWGAEKAYQQTYFGGRLLGAEIQSPPYDQFAELCGALGWRAETPEQLANALREAIAARRPAVIHTPIDPSALNALRKDLFAADEETSV